MKAGNRRSFITLTFAFTLAMGLGLALALLWTLANGQPARAAPAGELRVCPSGCTYSSVQAAVDAAEPGDVIKVAEGTYTDVHVRDGITQVVYITKTLTVRGGYSDDFSAWDPEKYPTLLNAQGQGRVIYIGGYINPTVEGLHLTGGDSSGLGGSVYDNDAGGGLYVLHSSAAISGNHIYGNTGYRGAGVWLQDYTGMFRANEVRNNAAGWAGAGLWLYESPTTIEGNSIVSNTAIYAAGLVLHWSDATLSGNDILSNAAAGGEGGGVAVLSSQAALDGNLILANSVNDQGGGVFISLSDATLTNNVIADNTANGRGSGLCVQGSSAHLIHNTIARNSGSGGGLYAASHSFGVDSHVMMTNTIVSGHTSGIIVSEHNTVTLQATLWHANVEDWSGAGTVNHLNDYTGDPAFAPDGYHLTAGSAAVDKGLDAGVTTDIDGDSRPVGPKPDLGADELWHRAFLPLVTRNR